MSEDQKALLLVVISAAELAYILVILGLVFSNASRQPAVAKLVFAMAAAVGMMLIARGLLVEDAPGRSFAAIAALWFGTAAYCGYRVQSAIDERKALVLETNAALAAAQKKKDITMTKTPAPVEPTVQEFLDEERRAQAREDRDDAVVVDEDLPEK